MKSILLVVCIAFQRLPRSCLLAFEFHREMADGIIFTESPKQPGRRWMLSELSTDPTSTTTTRRRRRATAAAAATSSRDPGHRPLSPLPRNSRIVDDDDDADDDEKQDYDSDYKNHNGRYNNCYDNDRNRQDDDQRKKPRAVAAALAAVPRARVGSEPPALPRESGRRRRRLGEGASMNSPGSSDGGEAGRRGHGGGGVPMGIFLDQGSGLSLPRDHGRWGLEGSGVSGGSARSNMGAR